MHRLFSIIGILLLCTSATWSSESEKLSLPAIFGDNMVLQRGRNVPIWGASTPGATITVEFAGKTYRTKARANGKWRLSLKPMKAQPKPADVTIAGPTTIVLKNVVVGDVWVCSGQSNMELQVNQSLQAEKESKAANYPLIRHIKVHHQHTSTPQNDIKGSWRGCTPDNVRHFTAVGYYFARRLHRELRVPIGLINASWSASKIEPWISADGFTEFMKQDVPPATDKTAWQNATRIYNGMIHPIVPYGIRGAIWYQGESNAAELMTYYAKMHALVGCWRQAWGQGDFPFYWVQLANFMKDTRVPARGWGYAKVREAQRLALDIPKSGMAVTIDIGETGNVHPKNKQDVGLRLARWALAKEYGKSILPSGPLYRSYTANGSKIRIRFDYVGSGLVVGKKEGLAMTKAVANGRLKRFAIAGADKKWFWAEAAIDGDTVVVSSPQVPEPVAVRYAYSTNPLGANLYNRDGLPASPFRTDK